MSWIAVEEIGNEKKICYGKIHESKKEACKSLINYLNYEVKLFSEICEGPGEILQKESDIYNVFNKYIDNFENRLKKICVTGQKQDDRSSFFDEFGNDFLKILFILNKFNMDGKLSKFKVCELKMLYQ